MLLYKGSIILFSNNVYIYLLQLSKLKTNHMYYVLQVKQSSKLILNVITLNIVWEVCKTFGKTDVPQHKHMFVVLHTIPLLIPVCQNSKDQYGKQAAPKHYALECHKCLKGMTPNDGSVIAMLCILQFAHFLIPLLRLQ